MVAVARTTRWDSQTIRQPCAEPDLQRYAPETHGQPAEMVAFRGTTGAIEIITRRSLIDTPSPGHSSGRRRVGWNEVVLRVFRFRQ